MDHHPVFNMFLPTSGDSAAMRLSRSRRSASETRSKQGNTFLPHDFNTWSSYRRGPGDTRHPDSVPTYWSRTVAPLTVERIPRSRSIQEFPGYEPMRDRSYFDRFSGYEHPSETMRRTQNKPSCLAELELSFRGFK
mmetsp:Transcript_36539/g.66965  ORF Transcript_36539/g.66965 Transcript_36539/m.66965 type:complete len:136 (+) Transcript_36539:74-481(+)